MIGDQADGAFSSKAALLKSLKRKSAESPSYEIFLLFILSEDKNSQFF